MADLKKVKQPKGVKLDHISKIYNDPKTGKNRFFTDLTALKFELVEGDGSSVEPVPAPAVPEDVVEAGDPDDLPF